jgi:hypothetical protein
MAGGRRAACWLHDGAHRPPEELARPDVAASDRSAGPIEREKTAP